MPTALLSTGLGAKAACITCLGQRLRIYNTESPERMKTLLVKMALTCRQAGMNSKVVFPSIFELSGLERMTVVHLRP